MSIFIELNTIFFQHFFVLIHFDTFRFSLLPYRSFLSLLPLSLSLSLISLHLSSYFSILLFLLPSFLFLPRERERESDRERGEREEKFQSIKFSIQFCDCCFIFEFFTREKSLFPFLSSLYLPFFSQRGRERKMTRKSERERKKRKRMKKKDEKRK